MVSILKFAQETASWQREKLTLTLAFWTSTHTKPCSIGTAPFLRDLEEMTAIGVSG